MDGGGGVLGRSGSQPFLGPDAEAAVIDGGVRGRSGAPGVEVAHDVGGVLGRSGPQPFVADGGVFGRSGPQPFVGTDAEAGAVDELGVGSA